VKYFDWNKEKNEWLKEERGVCFDDVLNILENEEYLDIVEHHNKKIYPNQKYFIVLLDNYVYLIPFVEDETKFFLKTIIPSRKATKKYLKNKM
jgi:uncharacterized DUF497 family protein